MRRHSNDVLDITYVGNHGVHVVASGLNLNQIDPKYFSMGNALLNKFQILSSATSPRAAAASINPRFNRGNCSGRTRNSAILTKPRIPRVVRITTLWT